MKGFAREALMRKPRKQQQPVAPAGPESSATRRRWTAPEKSRIVWQHLRDGNAVVDLAEQTGAARASSTPGLSSRSKRLEVALDDRRSPGDAEHARATVRKDARIRHLEEVVGRHHKLTPGDMRN